MSCSPMFDINFQCPIDGNAPPLENDFDKTKTVKTLFQTLSFISLKELLYYNRTISEAIRNYIPIIFLCIIIYLSIIHPIFFTENILEVEKPPSTFLRSFSMCLFVLLFQFSPFAILSYAFGQVPPDQHKPFISLLLILGMLFNTLIFIYFYSIYDFKSGPVFGKSNILLTSILLHLLQLIDGFYVSNAQLDFLLIGKQLIICFMSIAVNYLLFMFLCYFLIKFIDALGIEYTHYYHDVSIPVNKFAPVLTRFVSPPEDQYKRFTLADNYKGVIVGIVLYWIAELLRAVLSI